VAPLADHDSVAVVLMPVAPFAGVGDAGVDGDGAAAVENVHSGPCFAPPLFLATICQKYVAPGVNPVTV
jgi:hypothetical protein